MALSDPRELTPVAEALERLDAVDATRRLHGRDATLFSPDSDVQAEVAQRLGWLDVTSSPAGWVERASMTVADVRAAGLRRVVLAGMGGSSLAPEVFASVFVGSADEFTLEVLDTTHPDAVAAALDDTNLETTLVIVASKSGTTEETRAFGAHAARLVPDASHMLAITDPGSELEEQARNGGWLQVYTNPADIGGRFSALSWFGMLPAALVGVPLESVWASATGVAARATGPAREDPAAVLGAFMGGWAAAGRDKLTLLPAPELAALGDWVEQLVAESTGKDGTGIVPVVGEPVGPPEVYGDDRAFVEIRIGGRPVDGAQALTDAGKALLTLDLAEPADLGGAFLQWELATAYAGVVLGVNPFDEPNVTESKDNTRAALAAHARSGKLPAAEGGDVASLLAGVGPGDYVSFQAYLPRTREAQKALERARIMVRDRLGVATTAGFGPRFLHSTGQLHKGGPDSLVAVQVVDSATGGPDIPGRDYDFGTLIQAQAAGDLTSLRAHNRRAARLTIQTAHGLNALIETVNEATP